MRLSFYIHRNPLRAEMVKRLADYPWSSYRYYAYNKKPPFWLKTDLILSQMPGHRRYTSYRLKTQRYSKEDASTWEDVKHGLIYGSQAFVQKTRDQYLSPEKKEELPQHNSMFSEFSPEEILSRASEILGLDDQKARQARRIPHNMKDKRDYIIYLLWETGGLSNRQIGFLFDLTYSAVSRRVRELGNRFKKDKNLNRQYQTFKSRTISARTQKIF